jgi:hypothetical protein
MKLFGHVISVSSGLAIANYGYQWFREVPDWAYAGHATYENISAIFIFAFILTLFGEKDNG